ncbi:MAG: hypothetical protein II127_01275 [Ruminococcus sp.]|nr:hypothetical protein [Ruminococcus sp.]
MKKVLAILLAGMMTATAFAGCGGGETASKSDGGSGTASQASGGGEAAKVDPSWPDASLFGDEDNITLKVWAPDKAVALVQKQVEEFKSHYSDKKFTSIEVVAQGENDAATLIVNDPEKAADVFGFPSDQLNKLKDAQVLTPVAPALLDSVKTMNAEKTVTAATFDDQLYAFPETNDNGYYLVFDNSVVTEEDAKTLEGILEACKKAGKTFVMDAGNGFYSCIFPFTGGALIDGFEDDGITQKFVDYNEDEVIDTLMAFAKLMKDYKGVFVSQDPANISTGFKNGKVGAGIDGTWNSQPDKESLGDKFGAAKLPTVKVGDTDKQIISLFGYKYIGVNSHTKFQRSSQILAYYLAGQDCQEQRAKEIGWGPSNIEAQKAVSDDPILKAVSEQSENAVPQVNIAGTFWTSFGTLGSEMYKDGWKPDDRDATKALWEKTVKNVRDE